MRFLEVSQSSPPDGEAYKVAVAGWVETVNHELEEDHFPADMQEEDREESNCIAVEACELADEMAESAASDLSAILPKWTKEAMDDAASYEELEQQRSIADIKSELKIARKSLEPHKAGTPEFKETAGRIHALEDALATIMPKRGPGRPPKPRPEVPEAMPSPAFTDSKDLNLFFLPDSGNYYFRNSRGMFKPYAKKDMKESLAYRGISGDVLRVIREEHDVEVAQELAGWHTGLHIRENGGRRILATAGPNLIVPDDTVDAQPALNFIFQLCGGHLDLEDGQKIGERQYFILMAHIATAFKALYARIGGKPAFQQNKAIVMVGSVGSGKSAFQSEILKPIFGGRVADPARYFAGKTDFNDDLARCELLAFGDKDLLTDYKSRRALGASIKEHTANPFVSIHPKGKSAFTLNVFWLISLSINESEQYIKALPPLDDPEDGVKDKLNVYQAYPVVMPDSSAERVDYFAGVERALPGLAHVLLNWEIAPEYADTKRWGVREFHHPAVMERFSKVEPEDILLELIDECLFSEKFPPSYFDLGHLELKSKLLDGSEGVRSELLKIDKYVDGLGKLLGKLAKKSTRVKKARNARANKWRIYKTDQTPQEIAEAAAEDAAEAEEAKEPPALSGTLIQTEVAL